MHFHITVMFVNMPFNYRRQCFN